MESLRATSIQSYSKILPADVAKHVEKHVYDFGILQYLSENDAFKEFYLHKTRSLLHNLHKNPDLVQRVSAYPFNDPQAPNICSLKPHEIDPNTWKNIVDEFSEKEQKAQNVENLVQGSTQYKCRKCGHKKTLINFGQTRGADEPMTTFITCINCGAKWKH